MSERGGAEYLTEFSTGTQLSIAVVKPVTEKWNTNLLVAAQVLSGVLAEPQQRSNEAALVQSWLWGTIISNLEEHGRTVPKGVFRSLKKSS